MKRRRPEPGGGNYIGPTGAIEGSHADGCPVCGPIVTSAAFKRGTVAALEVAGGTR